MVYQRFFAALRMTEASLCSHQIYEFILYHIHKIGKRIFDFFCANFTDFCIFYSTLMKLFSRYRVSAQKFQTSEPVSHLGADGILRQI